MSKEVKRMVERAIAAFTALAFGTGLTIFSLLTPAIAHAFPVGGQVQSRAIYMSTAQPNTGATYMVTFKPASTTAIDGVVVDFCSTSPIIGDTCTKPANFSVGTPTVAFTSHTAGTNSPVSTTALPGTWASATSANTNRTLKFKTSSGDSGALSTSTLYSFDITTINNPSTTGTFYARIITFTANGVGSDYANYADTTPGSTDALDYGGFALSTVSNITITAKVQEALTFCASGPVDSTHLVDPLDGNNTGVGGGSSCAAATTPALTLGHGSPAPGVLDNTAVDRMAAYTQASTNASGGVSIRMHALNTCANAGLSSNGGSTCNINGMPTTSGIPAQVMTAGTTAFGLFVSDSATTTGVATSSGTITPNTNYHDSGHTNEGTGDLYYGMNQTANSGVISTYGDLIASSSAPVSQINNDLVFAATAGLTVPAGIYTGSESLIATGTF